MCGGTRCSRSREYRWSCGGQEWIGWQKEEEEKEKEEGRDDECMIADAADSLVLPHPGILILVMGDAYAMLAPREHYHMACSSNVLAASSRFRNASTVCKDDFVLCRRLLISLCGEEIWHSFLFLLPCSVSQKPCDIFNTQKTRKRTREQVVFWSGPFKETLDRG